jgi:hypothetical protein
MRSDQLAKHLLSRGERRDIRKKAKITKRSQIVEEIQGV